jgi:hypothetical protein
MTLGVFVRNPLHCMGNYTRHVSRIGPLVKQFPLPYVPAGACELGPLRLTWMTIQDYRMVTDG